MDPQPHNNAQPTQTVNTHSLHGIVLQDLTHNGLHLLLTLIIVTVVLLRGLETPWGLLPSGVEVVFLLDELGGAEVGDEDVHLVVE